MFILVRGTRSVELLEMIEDGMKIASWFATKASDDEFMIVWQGYQQTLQC